MNTKLEIKEGEFLLNGEKYNIYSGAIHYFRTFPNSWEDRLYKLKKCGFNTVETYVAWNLHEPKEGEFNFSGLCDIEKFIQVATKLDLNIIVRPGPYICAEWEFGGFPSWLINYKDIKFRCMNKTYLDKVDKFFDKLIPILKPYFSTNGGRIIAVQVENEYGSYGDDKEYLDYLKDGLINRGVDVLLFTSDGPNNSMLTGGSVEGLLATANFGSDPKSNFEIMEKRFAQYPKMCMEFWNGWFDHWGQKHVVRDSQSVYEDIKYMIENNMSFNAYMFHGGTNFGFMNGANLVDGDGYRPTVTSYDYDCFLTEWGKPTEKYWKVKSILNNDEEVTFEDRIIASGKVEFTSHAELFNNLDNISNEVKSTVPLTFEDLGINYGFVFYRHRIIGARDKHPLQIKGLKDRAQIYINGEEKATYYRADDYEKIDIQVCEGEEIQLDFLVENTGRINYGPHMIENKGITKGVWLGESYGNFVFGFSNYALELDNLDNLDFIEGVKNSSTPVFLKAQFNVQEAADSFIKLEGLKKGVVFINGFNIGRYWEIGPQKTLYVPAGVLVKGNNEIIVFNLHGSNISFVEFVDKHELEPCK